MTNDEVETLLSPEIVNLGLPADATQTLMAAAANAGLAWTVAQGGAAAPAAETTDAKRLRVSSFPGVFIVGARIGTRGWLAWYEVARGGQQVRSSPVFLPGDGDFNPAAA